MPPSACNALLIGALTSSFMLASLTPGIDSSAAIAFSSICFGMLTSAVVTAMRTVTRVPSICTSLTMPNETMSRE